MARLEKAIDRFLLNDPRLMPWIVMALSAGIAYAVQHWFIQDDAYISFVYARHFAEGHGLTWEPGSTEYGYTNFLHTLLVGLMMSIGLGPELSAALITFPSFVTALWLTFACAMILHRERPEGDRRFLAFCTTLTLAFNYSFTAFASGGLETMLVVMLVLMVYYQAIRLCWLREAIHPMWLALPTGLSLATRLDSAVLLIPSYLMILDYVMKGRLSQFSVASLLRFALRVALLPTLMVFSVGLFAYLYYGDVLPNTFYVKMPGASENLVRDGLNYFWYYIEAQAYVPLALVVLLIFLRFAGQGTKENHFYVLGPCVLWVAYVIYFGGDFIEFRMVVPALPFFYLYVVSQIAGPSMDTARRRGLALLLVVTLLSNLYHDRTFNVTPANFSIRNLNRLLVFPKYNWKQAGRTLNKLFYTGSPEDVIIATKAAGAIPYFSRLRSVDQYGLNDHWVSRFGQPLENVRIVGHRRIATLSYLRQRGVNLVIDHPMFICDQKVAVYRQQMLKDLPVVLIPTMNQCYLVAYYLTPHPRIAQLLENKVMLELSQINPGRLGIEPNY